MKIQSKESEFKPVTITLQSQDELDLMLEVFHRAGGTAVRDIFGNTSTLPYELRKAGAAHRGEWNISGDIYIEK